MEQKTQQESPQELQQKAQLKVERIKGRYKIIVATIAAVAAVVGSVLGGRYFPIENNRSYDNYIQKDIVTQTETDLQKKLDSLQKKIDELQETNESGQQEIATLTKENKAKQGELVSLRETNKTQQEGLAELQEENENNQKKITELEEKIDDLRSKIPNLPTDDPGLDSKETVKLTSLQMIGNNRSDFNFIYGTLENDENAMSSLGETFGSSISMRCNGNIDFYLGGAYQTLNSIICISESTKNIDAHSSILTILAVKGNGSTETVETLYTSPDITMGFIPTPTGQINVSEVEHLRISFYSNGNVGDVPRIVLGNPELILK